MILRYLIVILIFTVVLSRVELVHSLDLCKEIMGIAHTIIQNCYFQSGVILLMSSFQNLNGSQIRH